MNTDTMTILVNQMAHQLPAHATLLDAITAAGVTPPFAAAVNMQFVPRSAHATHVLQPNDQVELIAPITGG
jgi:sulfur carrier protein